LKDLSALSFNPTSLKFRRASKFKVGCFTAELDEASGRAQKKIKKIREKFLYKFHLKFMV